MHSNQRVQMNERLERKPSNHSTFWSEYTQPQPRRKVKSTEEKKSWWIAEKQLQINNKLFVHKETKQKEVGVLCGFVHLNEIIFVGALCGAKLGAFVYCELCMVKKVVEETRRSEKNEVKPKPNAT